MTPTMMWTMKLTMNSNGSLYINLKLYLNLNLNLKLKLKPDFPSRKKQTNDPAQIMAPSLEPSTTA
jgi:hypothetical protein